jgi:hypothetical protein
VKHKIDDEVRVRVTHDHDVHVDDIESLIDKITESALILFGASAALHILGFCCSASGYY